MAGEDDETRWRAWGAYQRVQKARIIVAIALFAAALLVVAILILF